VPVALQEVSVVALNGQIYLTGGDSNQGRSQALYLYDPASRAWSSRAPYPGIARDHIGHGGRGRHTLSPISTEGNQLTFLPSLTLTSVEMTGFSVFYPSVGPQNVNRFSAGWTELQDLK